MNIKKYHHFRFSFENPGIVYIKMNADSLEEEIDILNWKPELLAILQPKGLSIERQWNLYEQVQPYCTEEFQDQVCPQPTIPNPKRRRVAPITKIGLKTMYMLYKINLFITITSITFSCLLQVFMCCFVIYSIFCNTFCLLCENIKAKRILTPIYCL